MPTKAVRLTMPLVGEANPAGYLVMVPGASVLIRQNGVALVGSAGPGTPAVFSDNAKTAMTNPVPTGVTPGTAGVDTEGRLLVYLNPGSGYDIQATVGNATTTAPLPDVGVDVEDVADLADFTALEAVVAGKQDTIDPGTLVESANNLSDLADAAEARANIGAPAVADLLPKLSETDDRLSDDVAELDRLSLTAIGANPRPIDVVDGVLYGHTGGLLYSSVDSGTTWQALGSTAALGGGSQVNGLRGMADGEVLLIKRADGCFRSTGWATNPATATWANVVTPTTGAWVLPGGVDVSGAVVIVCEYATSPRDPSKKVWVSVDSGATFTEKLNLDTLYPGQEAAVHWHAVCIDPWANDRLWACNGDGPRALRYSDDAGDSWVLFNTSEQPFTLTAGTNGIVCGSDRIPDGLLRILRTDDPADMVLERLYTARFPSASLWALANRGVRDDKGRVYVGFGSQVDGYPTTILASRDGLRGNEVYRLQPASTTDRAKVLNVMLDGNGYLIAEIETNAVAYMLRAPAAGKLGTMREERVNTGGILGGVADRISVAVGELSASNDSSVAVGPAAKATGLLSVAIGNAALSTGQWSVAIGQAAQAASTSSISIGYGAGGSGTDRVAIGRQASAAVRSTAVGSAAVASGIDAVVVGHLSTATIDGAIAIGKGCTAGFAYSVAIGLNITTTADRQVALGARHVALRQVTTLPTAPPAGEGRLFLIDVAGKMQLQARFPTGAVQVLATEP